MRKIFFFLIIITGCVPCTVQGQSLPDTSFSQHIPVLTDTGSHRDSVLQIDTVASKSRLFQPNAKKAALYSGIVPGLGQAYARQYWKLPVIYAGAGAAAYFITKNLNNYRTYRKAYIARLSREPDDYDYLTDTDLQVLQEGYKKNLDMAVLFSALGYTIQILDALAAAHLKNFDISEDISMRFQPLTAPNGGVGWGVAVIFK